MATVVRTATSVALEISGKTPVPLRSLRPPSIQVLPVATPGGLPTQLLRGGNSITLGEIAAEWDANDPGALLEWVQANLRQDPSPISGAALVSDFNHKLRRRIAFEDAVLTALQWPVLDATDAKRPFTLGLRFLPNRVSDEDGGGKAGPDLGSKRKALPVGSFALRGLPFAAEQVSRVELPLQQVHQGGRPGTMREAQRSPVLDAGQVTMVAMGRSAVAARAWVQTVIADGKVEGPELLDFSIDLLDAAMRKALATLQFTGCLLLSADEPELGGAAVEAIDSMQLRFAVQGLDFKLA